jgi:hypothetical protein
MRCPSNASLTRDSVTRSHRRHGTAISEGSAEARAPKLNVHQARGPPEGDELALYGQRDLLRGALSVDVAAVRPAVMPTPARVMKPDERATVRPGPSYANPGSRQPHLGKSRDHADSGGKRDKQHDEITSHKHERPPQGCHPTDRGFDRTYATEPTPARVNARARYRTRTPQQHTSHAARECRPDVDCCTGACV